MLKLLKHARLDGSYEADLRKLLAVPARSSSPPTAAPLNGSPPSPIHRAQSAIVRFTSDDYDLLIQVDSYSARLKPTLPPTPEHKQ